MLSATRGKNKILPFGRDGPSPRRISNRYPLFYVENAATLKLHKESYESERAPTEPIHSRPQLLLRRLSDDKQIYESARLLTSDSILPTKHRDVCVVPELDSSQLQRSTDLSMQYMKTISTHKEMEEMTET